MGHTSGIAWPLSFDIADRDRRGSTDCPDILSIHLGRESDVGDVHGHDLTGMGTAERDHLPAHHDRSTRTNLEHQHGRFHRALPGFSTYRQLSHGY